MTDEASKDAVIIDPANPPEYVYILLPGNSIKLVLTYPSFRVAPVLKEAIDSGKINLTAIINTHQ